MQSTSLKANKLTKKLHINQITKLSSVLPLWWNVEIEPNHTTANYVIIADSQYDSIVAQNWHYDTSLSYTHHLPAPLHSLTIR